MARDKIGSGLELGFDWLGLRVRDCKMHQMLAFTPDTLPVPSICSSY